LDPAFRRASLPVDFRPSSDITQHAQIYQRSGVYPPHHHPGHFSVPVKSFPLTHPYGQHPPPLQNPVKSRSPSQSSVTGVSTTPQPRHDQLSSLLHAIEPLDLIQKVSLLQKLKGMVMSELELIDQLPSQLERSTGKEDLKHYSQPLSKTPLSQQPSNTQGRRHSGPPSHWYPSQHPNVTSSAPPSSMSMPILPLSAQGSPHSSARSSHSSRTGSVNNGHSSPHDSDGPSSTITPSGPSTSSSHHAGQPAPTTGSETMEFSSDSSDSIDLPPGQSMTSMLASSSASTSSSNHGSSSRILPTIAEEDIDHRQTQQLPFGEFQNGWSF
ncbi:hypothetical protein ADUPG1_008894, partial [Aduncisulcus paluster]